MKIIPFCSHKADKALKTSGDANHRFFSNWAISPFIVDGISYICSEQYMMHMKAKLFDNTMSDKILAFNRIPDEPDQQWDHDMKSIKELGRQIKNFKSEVWSSICKDVMVKGLYAKFSQNEIMRKTLLETGDAVLCEASSYDKIWGIGLAVDDPRVYDQTQWQGKNLLGQCLMEVRSII